MNDIKKSSRNLKYNGNGITHVPIIRSNTNRSIDAVSSRSHKNILNRKVEDFEESNYDEEEISVENFYNRNNSKNVRNKILSKKPKKKFSSKFKIISAILTTLIIIFLLTTYVFNSATVEVSPKVFNIKANTISDFVNLGGDEEYQIIEIKKEVSKEVEKSEVKKTNTKAAGNITIYNNFNENTQKLVKNTRFESANGKIFRISDSVIIPGKTASGLGSISVKVTADSFGSNYNIAPAKFKIPGFKGSLRYDGFYAESNAPMSGGSLGESSNYSAEDIDSADMILKSEIKELIKKDLTSVYKKDFSVIYETNLIEYSNNKDNLIKGIDTKYVVSANAKIILVKDKVIAKNLGKKYINNYTEEIVIVKDLTKLKISLASSTKNIKEKISVSLSGDADLIMEIDENKLKSALASKNNTKEEFILALSKFTEIKQAVPKIFPPWIKTFPKNINKIEIITKKE